MPDKADEMVVTDHDVDDCAVSQAEYGEDPRELDETDPRWLCILQTTSATHHPIPLPTG